MTPPRVSECRSCHAPIFWAVSVNEKSTPVDVEPTDDGNLLFADDGRSVTVLGPLELLLHDREAQPLRLNHFVTCPDRDSWKR